MRKYIKKLPQEQCENCGRVGGVVVTMHIEITYGGKQELEGLRDCRICLGLPQEKKDTQ